MREMIGNKSMHMVKANEHITDILHRILIEQLKSYHNVIKHFKMLQ